MTFGSRFDIIYIMENLINTIDIAYLIILVGCGYTSYFIGKKDGISVTLDYMKDAGHIDFED